MKISLTNLNETQFVSISNRCNLQSKQMAQTLNSTIVANNNSLNLKTAL